MAKKILFSIFNVILIAMCIISCLFRWYIPGWIMLAVAVIWFGYQNFKFCKDISLIGLISVGVWILLCTCGWLPIALVGFSNLELFQIFVMFGAIASGLTIPFYFYK